MKRIFMIFAIFFAFTVCFSSYTNAEVVDKIGSVITNATDSVYHDGRAVVDTLYHDGKAVVGTVYEDAKDGFKNLYPDIKSAVMSIAQGIGVAAEHVYTVLVKKYFVLGIKEACIMLCGIIALIIGFIGWRRATPEGQPITYRVIVPALFLFIGICVLCNVDYDNMLMGIINPEYGAINYILDYAKEITK